MLTIALLGACPVQLAELTADLDQAARAMDRQIMLVTASGTEALPAALAGFDLVLLAGLDALGEVGADSDAASHLEAANQSIRTALALAGVAYRVLYGTAGERLAHALQAVQSLQPSTSKSIQAPRLGSPKKQPWVWMCEKCSDPQCEHRLLTDLLARRDREASPPGQQARLY